MKNVRYRESVEQMYLTEDCLRRNPLIKRITPNIGIPTKNCSITF